MFLPVGRCILLTSHYYATFVFVEDVSSPSRGVTECLFTQPITLRSDNRADAYCSVALLAKLYVLLRLFIKFVSAGWYIPDVALQCDVYVH